MQSIDSPNYKNVARSLSLVEQALLNLLEHMNLVGFMLLNLEFSGYYFFLTTVCIFVRVLFMYQHRLLFCVYCYENPCLS